MQGTCVAAVRIGNLPLLISTLVIVARGATTLVPRTDLKPAPHGFELGPVKNISHRPEWPYAV
jgi:hypothetical protein